MGDDVPAGGVDGDVVAPEVPSLEPDDDGASLDPEPVPEPAPDAEVVEGFVADEDPRLSVL